MPFLNPPDVLPEAMRFLIRALLASDGSLPEDELFRLVAPLGLVEAIGRSVPEESTDAPDSATGFKLGGRTIARTSLAALRTVQLVEQQTVGHRIVTATASVRTRFTSCDAVTPSNFAAFLRDTVLAASQDELDKDDPTAGAEDLAFATALLFSIPDPLEPIAAFEHGSGKTLFDYQTHISDNIGDWIIRNRERYVSLLRWVTYLGFGRLFNLSTGTTLLFVDPSAALRHLVVPLVTSQLTVAELLDRLGPLMPYSDRGKVANALRTRLPEKARLDHVSPGLALGLQVLHLNKEIQLLALSDHESFAFPIRGDRSVRYSHIAPAGGR